MGVQSRFRTSQSNGRDIRRAVWKRTGCIYHHAGLECGLFLGKKPDLDCVSMGPDLLDIHSFNEKLDIASTQRTWEYLKGILAKLK